MSVLLILLILSAVSCGKERRATATPEIITTNTGIEMILIPAGWFEMGSNRGKDSEQPAHRVWVAAFLMDRYEVTQKQYSKLVLGNPSHFKGPDNPMEQMRWSDAALYCNARSRAEGLDPCYDEETGKCNFQASGYRLPTESEWEYACRAGTNSTYSFGRDARLLKDYAWYAENSLERTHPAGQKKPNPWGLYDMYGNVAEWCNDIYDENYYKNSPEKNPRGPAEGDKYVLRGGAWSSSADSCRSSYRVGEDPGFQDACFARDNIGFRCVRSAQKTVSNNPLNPPLLRGNPPQSPFGKGGDYTPSILLWKLRITHKFPSLAIAHKSPPLAKGGQGGFERMSLGEIFEWCRDTTIFKIPPAPFFKGGVIDPLLTAPAYAGSIEHPVSRTGFIYHEIYLQHKTGASHPESPQRLEAIVKRLKEKGLSEKESSLLRLITPVESLPQNPPSPLFKGEHPRRGKVRACPERSEGMGVVEWITAIHTPQYVERVKKSCEEGIEYLDSPDTPISSETYKVALAAVGGVLLAIDEVMAGKVKNAFCAIRPPGHHALKDKAMGFCIFNNVAIGARYIQKKYRLSKVLIVDWDVHHGNGTQAAFYDDPTVLYFSTHQHPFYPGSGSEEERGTGKGLGYTVNVPLPAGSGDKDYKKTFEEILKPRAIEFDPDFVLISAGFDAHKDDPLGGMNVTAGGFAELTSIVKEIAEKCCDGRIVSVLEGGYDLNGLAESADAHISVLGSMKE